MKAGSAAESALGALDAKNRAWTARRLSVWAVAATVLVFYIVCWRLAQVDPAKLATGLPKLGHWLAQSWPPKLDEL
ncbi:MAG: phosphonate ABC transporter, permease protein PhnE, partial [Burkholderiales bacterium]